MFLKLLNILFSTVSYLIIQAFKYAHKKYEIYLYIFV